MTSYTFVRIREMNGKHKGAPVTPGRPAASSKMVDARPQPR